MCTCTSCSFYTYIVSVEVEFESGDYSVQESDERVEVCSTLDGMAQFPVSFRITAAEGSPRDAQGQCNDIKAQLPDYC